MKKAVDEKMKSNGFRTFIIISIVIFFIFFIYGCANASNLELKTSSAAQELNQVSTIGTEIGNIPPAFTVVTTDGKAVRLGDFTGQQKPIIVYFMATWCPFCAEDYRELSKVYRNYESNVSILSISLDLNEDLNILREYKNKYPELQSTMFAAGQPEILANYKVIKTTTKYAIDRNGKIIYAGFGVFNEEQWKQLLDALAKN